MWASTTLSAKLESGLSVENPVDIVARGGLVVGAPDGRYHLNDAG
jgi:hypothetical protein